MKPDVSRTVLVGALIGTALGACLGIVPAALLFLGWVVCASTGTSCGNETHATLVAVGAIVAGAASGAALGAAFGAMVARIGKRSRPEAQSGSTSSGSRT